MHANHAATVLVTSGIFRYSRNPVYVAMAVVYLAVSLLCNSAWMLALMLPALIVTHYGVIKREENHLRHQFGDEFNAYVRAVRPWL